MTVPLFHTHYFLNCSHLILHFSQSDSLIKVLYYLSLDVRSIHDARKGIKSSDGYTSIWHWHRRAYNALKSTAKVGCGHVNSDYGYSLLFEYFLFFLQISNDNLFGCQYWFLLLGFGHNQSREPRQVPFRRKRPQKWVISTFVISRSKLIYGGLFNFYMGIMC